MAAGSTAQDAQAAGLYCSTSGTVFTDKESLTEHYKSDFHRYNLKRKVAGLPPVTHEWFLARKSQLTSIAEGPPVQRIWVCPLTNKKFLSENTYVAHTKSKKYRQALKESGGPPPQPHVIVKRDRPSAEPESARPTTSATAPTAFNITPAAKSGPAAEQAKRELHAAGSRMDAATTAGMDAGSDSNDDAHSDSSDWETDTDGDDDEGNEQASRLQQGDSQDAEEHQDASEWEEWDVCVSLFDNHVSASFEANLDYMYKHFGFFLPDAEYLTDPQGLMKYLGAKLRYGGIPLHARGDDPNAKQFRSLHAVQRHMVDTALTQMLYDDNEEEYEDFYDYSAMEEEEEQAKALVAAQVEQAAEQGAAGELEIVVPGRSGGAAGGRILGARDFARYYRQRHRAPELRHSVVVNQLVQRYRNLGIATITDGKTAEEKRRSKEAMKQRRRADAQQVRQQMKQNVINNLPRNVPY